MISEISASLPVQTPVLTTAGFGFSWEEWRKVFKKLLRLKRWMRVKNVEINGHLRRSAHFSKCVCMHICVHSWVCIICMSTHALYVYLYVCSYECASACMYRTGCSILFIHEHDPMNVLVFAQVHSCMCVHGSTSVCFHFVVCVCICMYLHVNLYMCAYAFVYASIWLCMSAGMVHSVNAYVHVVWMCTCIRMYTCICMCACDMQLCGFGPMCAGLMCGLMNMSMWKYASTLEYMCVCLCAYECMSVCFVFCVHEPLYMQLQDYVCVYFLCLFVFVCTCLSGSKNKSGVGIFWNSAY